MMDKTGTSSNLSAMAGRIKAAVIVLTALSCLPGGLAGQSYAGAVQDANAGRYGQTIELNRLPAKGKTTVVDLYSPLCPPCMRLAPLLEQLAQKRSDLAIKKVNIQRPEVQGKIDWQSPLAQQLGLHAIPHFMIFNAKGGLESQGKEATKQVIVWLQEAGLIGK